MIEEGNWFGRERERTTAGGRTDRFDWTSHDRPNTESSRKWENKRDVTDGWTANVIATLGILLQFSQYERDADLCMSRKRWGTAPPEDVRSTSRTIEVLSNSFYHYCGPGILENNVFTNNNIPLPRNNICRYCERASNEKVFIKLVYKNIKINK